MGTNEGQDEQQAPPYAREPEAIVWQESADEEHRQFTLANLLMLLLFFSVGFATLQWTSLEVFAAGAGAATLGLLMLLAIRPGSAWMRLAWWITLATYLTASAIAIS